MSSKSAYLPQLDEEYPNRIVSFSRISQGPKENARKQPKREKERNLPPPPHPAPQPASAHKTLEKLRK